MDNADLERLSVSPAKLSPVFHKDTLEYDIVVGSEVSQLKLSLLTVDEDASYGIKASSVSENPIVLITSHQHS